MNTVDRVSLVREFFTATGSNPAVGNLSGAHTSAVLALTLASAATNLTGGLEVLSVNSEKILAGGSGTSLTVEPAGLGRGAFGSTAAAHSDTDAVTRTSLSDLVGSRTFFGELPQGDENILPSLVFNFRGRHKSGVDVVAYPRVQVRCLGGKNNNGEYDPMLPELIHRLLREKLNEIAGVTSLASGAVISAVEDGEGMSLWDKSSEPHWPYTLMFINFELRNN